MLILRVPSWFSTKFPQRREIFGSAKSGFAGGPIRVGVVERDGGEAHLGAGVLDLPAVGDVDERVVFLVVDPAHRDRLEKEAHALREDFLAAGPERDLADRDRPGPGAR